MAEGYTTTDGVLAEQVRKVGDVLAELRAAAETAGSVALTSTAFGEQAIEAVAVLDRLGADGLDTVVSAMNTMVEIGARLRDTAVEYDRQEANARAAFARLADPMAGSSGLIA